MVLSRVCIYLLIIEPCFYGGCFFFFHLDFFFFRMVNAFKDQIGASVESTIANKLSEGVSDLDSFLQSLPKEIPVDDKAALNVTFTTDPILRDSSITFEIDGLFTKAETNQVLKSSSLRNSAPSSICPGNSKMLGISLDEAVFNSAAALYYNVSSLMVLIFIYEDFESFYIFRQSLCNG